jgi:hypothetical protein
MKAICSSEILMYLYEEHGVTMQNIIKFRYNYVRCEVGTASLNVHSVLQRANGVFLS